MLHDRPLRPSGVQPITNSTVGARLVRLMAEGLVSYCDRGGLPYPQTLDQFEKTLVLISRVTGFQGGLPFTIKGTHRDFYRLLGMSPELAGTPHAELKELAKTDPAVARGIKLILAFAGAAKEADREFVNARSARIFREDGGPEFELLAQAFAVGDCQRDLVFEEMQLIIRERAQRHSLDPGSGSN